MKVNSGEVQPFQGFQEQTNKTQLAWWQTTNLNYKKKKIIKYKKLKLQEEVTILLIAHKVL